MGEPAEQEVQNIRHLLRTATPDNIESANHKLALLASFLTSVQTNMAEGQSCDSTLQKFIARLPAEMAAIQVLMQAPLNFFRGLNSLRASKFGSYEQTGALRNFEFETTGKTLIHL